MKLKKYFIGLVLTITSLQASSERSVLKWSPAKSEEPKVSVEVQWFKDNDYLSKEKQGMGKLQPFSAVMDAFCGDSKELRREFSDWVKDYRFPLFYHHPKHPKPANDNVVVTCFSTPYEIYQSKFIEWMKDKRGKDDFLVPNARKTNPYKGDLVDPVVKSPSAVTKELLQKTNGYVTIAEKDKITFIGDNRVNPLRWICPINEVHHREQASWAMRLHSDPQGWELSKTIMQENRQEKKTNRRLVLKYKVALTVEDGRDELKEWTIYDYLQEGQAGLIKQMRENVFKYAVNGETAPNGRKLEYLQEKLASRYMRTRLDPVNFQLVVGFNMRERGDRYRLAEFMLASYNQENVWVHPKNDGSKHGHLGVYSTANMKFNKQVRDGACSGNSAWWRAPINVLNDEDLQFGEGSAWKSKDNYIEMDAPSLERTIFEGEIDITKFYRQSLKGKYFPGQRGYWVKNWLGFEGNETAAPEEHGVEWAFLIFENHGPLKVKTEVIQFDIVALD
ncbi:hypothetical protein PQO01_10105 [Lentisphaera marina]|uniref:hypothetical protein n=1 Tax=Lentisphaera marina TaxID=1111041 RepID=UPI0023656131|nr:hypothetical protein [Lentisphaera marina]MDD7985305.1 hypothetical protein [Lentisphaera marina]